MSDRLSPAGPLPWERWRQREELLDRFEEGWRQGRPALDDYLPPGHDSHTLVELIQTDLECRLKAGEAARMEEYLRRYSGLAGDIGVVLGLAAVEYPFRRRREPDLGPE